MNTRPSSDVFVVEAEPSYPEFPYAKDSPLGRALEALFDAWGLGNENPFGGLLKPGERVLIKPNWVRDVNPEGHDLDSLVTHSSLISYMMEFAARALDGRGTIVVGDAPLQNCNFANLLRLSRMNDVADRFRTMYPHIDLIVEDWRLTVFRDHDWFSGWTANHLQESRAGVESERLAEYILVDLAKDSFLEEISDRADLFRVTRYKPSLLKAHHQPGKHEYLVTRRVSQVDLMINLPKMKTHIKAGLTGALKNLVGINGHKEFLPHHTRGPYFKGGDNYCLPNYFRETYESHYDEFWEHSNGLHPLRRKARSFRLAVMWKLSRLLGHEAISSGSWSGNDTVWRMALDLNHVLHFSDWSPRNVINIVDGITAGEGEGPMRPTPKAAGLLVGGANPAYVDAVLAKLMGYTIARVPIVYHAINNRKSKLAGPPLEDYTVSLTPAGRAPTTVPFDGLPNFSFKKPYYWQRAEARRVR